MMSKNGHSWSEVYVCASTNAPLTAIDHNRMMRTIIGITSSANDDTLIDQIVHRSQYTDEILSSSLIFAPSKHCN